MSSIEGFVVLSEVSKVEGLVLLFPPQFRVHALFGCCLLFVVCCCSERREEIVQREKKKSQ